MSDFSKIPPPPDGSGIKDVPIPPPPDGSGIKENNVLQELSEGYYEKRKEIKKQFDEQNRKEVEAASSIWGNFFSDTPEKRAEYKKALSNPEEPIESKGFDYASMYLNRAIEGTKQGLKTVGTEFNNMSLAMMDHQPLKTKIANAVETIPKIVSGLSHAGFSAAGVLSPELAAFNVSSDAAKGLPDDVKSTFVDYWTPPDFKSTPEDKAKQFDKVIDFPFSSISSTASMLGYNPKEDSWQKAMLELGDLAVPLAAHEAGGAVKENIKNIDDLKQIHNKIANATITEEESKQYKSFIEGLKNIDLGQLKKAAIEKGTPEALDIAAKIDETVKKSQEDRSKLGVEFNPLEGLSESMVKTFDRVQQGLPTDITAVDEASSFLYDKYKNLQQMKTKEIRPLTTDQINTHLDQLGQDITTLEDYKNQFYAPDEIQNTPNQQIASQVIKAQKEARIRQLAEEQSVSAYNVVSKGEGAVNGLKKTLDNALTRGLISPETHQQAIFKIDIYKDYYKKTEDSNLGDTQRRRVFDLTWANENLKQQIENINAELESDPNNPILLSKKRAKEDLHNNNQREIDNHLITGDVGQQTAVAEKVQEKIAKDNEPKEEPKKDEATIIDTNKLSHHEKNWIVKNMSAIKEDLGGDPDYAEAFNKGREMYKKELEAKETEGPKKVTPKKEPAPKPVEDKEPEIESTHKEFHAAIENDFKGKDYNNLSDISNSDKSDHLLNHLENSGQKELKNGTLELGQYAEKVVNKKKLPLYYDVDISGKRIKLASSDYTNKIKEKNLQGRKVAIEKILPTDKNLDDLVKEGIVDSHKVVERTNKDGKKEKFFVFDGDTHKQRYSHILVARLEGKNGELGEKIGNIATNDYSGVNKIKKGAEGLRRPKPENIKESAKEVRPAEKVGSENFDKSTAEPDYETQLKSADKATIEEEDKGETFNITPTDKEPYRDQYQKGSSLTEENKVLRDKKIEQLKKAIPDVNVIEDNSLSENIAGQLDKDGKTIRLNPDYNYSDTPIHEFGHVLIDMLGGVDNKVVLKGIDQLKDTRLWSDTKVKYPELPNDMLAKEVLAESIGREGAKIFDTKEKQTKFKNWLDGMFYKIKSALGIDKNVAKKLANDLLAGKRIKGDLKPSKEVQKSKVNSNEEYERAYELNKNKIAKIKKNYKGISEDAKQLVSDIFAPVSTVLERISPKLKTALRDYQLDLSNNIKKSMLPVENFLIQTKKIRKESARDFSDFDLARKNDDLNKIKELSEKYGLQKNIDKVHFVLEDLDKKAKREGVPVAFRIGDHPLHIKDFDGLMNYISREKGFDSESIKNAFEIKEAYLERAMTHEERAEELAQILSTRTSSSVSHITPEMNKFYSTSDQALINYVNSMNIRIDTKRFSGSGSEKLGYENIGGSLWVKANKLLSKSEITPEHYKELQKVIGAYFNEEQAYKAVTTLKNISFIDVMGHFGSALTQLSHVGFALHDAGVINTVKELGKSLVGKSEIKKSDLFAKDMMNEYGNTFGTQKVVSKIFKYAGLNFMDALAKETIINAHVDKLRSQANKLDTMGKYEKQAFMKRLNDFFELEQVNQIIEDLKSNKMTDDVMKMAYNRILDLQPVAKSEVPLKYLENPNGRWLYSLKQYSLKIFDVYRREIFTKLKSKEEGDRKQGLKNLVRLSVSLAFVNATTDELRDLMEGKKVDLSDRVLYGFLKVAGMNSYIVNKTKKEGLASSVKDLITPNVPLQTFDDLYKDIFGNGKGKSIKHIPVVGKLIYDNANPK